MSRPARPAGAPRRGAFGQLTTFLLGVPVGAGLLLLVSEGGPIQNAALQRYTAHMVEKVEVILFCCALCALVGKVVNLGKEKAACRRSLLPASSSCVRRSPSTVRS